MKKAPLVLNVFAQKSKLLLYLLLLVTLSGTYSCNNKNSDHSISSADSLAITKVLVKSNIDKIYTLKLPTAMQQKIFSAANVKQIQFKWHSYPGNSWGLDAYGMDEKGNQVSGPFELEIVTTIPPTTNYQFLDRAPYYVWQRGDLKELLKLGTLRQDVPIKDGEFKDLLLTPTQDPYTDQNSDTNNDMYFVVTLYPAIVQLNVKKKFAGQQGFINPVPPGRPACISCDDVSPY